LNRRVSGIFIIGFHECQEKPSIRVECIVHEDLLLLRKARALAKSSEIVGFYVTRLVGGVTEGRFMGRWYRRDGG
jgi:hypothetical protein